MARQRISEITGGVVNLPDHIAARRAAIDAALELDIDVAVIVDELLRSQYTRVPIWRDEPENIIGILHTKDLLTALVRSSGDISNLDIMSFADVDEIDEKYIEQPYYLAPDEKAAQAYGLLREALKESKKVAIARFVLRSREHLAMLQAEGDVIVLHQMRFAAEIRSPEELNLPGKVEAEERQMKMALQLIEQLTEPWNPEQYKDTYVEDLMRIIEQKARGEEIEAEEEPVPIEVVDLFAQLSQSLQMVREGRDGRLKLFIIDGLGGKELIPLSSIRYFARLKAERRVRRFYSKILAHHPDLSLELK